MRAGLHAALTIGLTLISGISSMILGLLLFIHNDWDWGPVFIVTILLPICGFLLPGLVMRRVPCICPECGGKAKSVVAAWNLSIIPAPIFAWECTACNWSTYYWSAYQQASREAQRQKSRRFFARLFSFGWVHCSMAKGSFVIQTQEGGEQRQYETVKALSTNATTQLLLACAKGDLGWKKYEDWK